MGLTLIGLYVNSFFVVIVHGLRWQDGADPLGIELKCIEMGGVKGVPLFQHYLNARKLLWPHRYEHRWTRLIHEEITNNTVTVLMGAASTSKTSTATEWCLISYWARPDNTLVLMSTTTLEKLETNVFGECKMLFDQARARHPWLAGNVLDHKHSIFTETVEEDEVRDRRKGIVGKPCYENGKWKGDAIFVGIKQDYVIFLGDELSFMAGSFIRAWSPLFANPHVKIIGSGNPNHDPDDTLGVAAEPIEGWNSLPEPDKTTCWNTRFLGGRCVNLVGTDSPNFDVGPDKPEPYPKLIGRRFAERVEHDSGKNSPEYYRLVKGVMKMSLAESRVITRELCRINKCHHQAQWANNDRIRVHGLDPSYGGADQCYEIVLEFGESLDGKILVSFLYWGDIKLDARRTDIKIEDQIAEHVKGTLQKHNVPTRNSGYDSVGKGTIGFGFSHTFGGEGPEPVDSGQKPTKRPVRNGLFVTDEVTGIKRPKRCDEHYSKFITEAWFSTRLCAESSQLRNLPEEIMMEGVKRLYYTVAGNKIEVEPKDDLKERTGKSPNKYDAFAVALEMARRRGFVIDSIGPDPTESTSNWKDNLSLDYHKAIREQLLDHAV